MWIQAQVCVHSGIFEDQNGKEYAEYGLTVVSSPMEVEVVKDNQSFPNNNIHVHFHLHRRRHCRCQRFHHCCQHFYEEPDARWRKGFGSGGHPLRMSQNWDSLAEIGPIFHTLCNGI